MIDNPRLPKQAERLDRDMSRLPGFRSAKAVLPIRYPERWHRDLLIQATLDPTVISIAEYPSPGSHMADLHLLFERETGSTRVRATRDENILSDASDPEHILIPRSTVLSEPIVSNARAVWTTRKVQVPIGDRLRIMARMADHPNGLKISDAARIVHCADIDPFAAILSLACSGALAVDLQTILSPDTLVRGPNTQGARHDRHPLLDAGSC